MTKTPADDSVDGVADGTERRTSVSTGQFVENGTSRPAERGRPAGANSPHMAAEDGGTCTKISLYPCGRLALGRHYHTVRSFHSRRALAMAGGRPLSFSSARGYCQRPYFSTCTCTCAPPRSGSISTSRSTDVQQV